MAREVAWAQRIETRGGLPVSTAAGHQIPGLVLDMDASIVVCHSQKQSAAATWKHTSPGKPPKPPSTRPLQPSTTPNAGQGDHGQEHVRVRPHCDHKQPK